MPRFETLLARQRRRTQTPEEMLAAIRYLNAMHGGRVIEPSRKD